MDRDQHWKILVARLQEAQGLTASLKAELSGETEFNRFERLEKELVQATDGVSKASKTVSQEGLRALKGAAGTCRELGKGSSDESRRLEFERLADLLDDAREHAEKIAG